MRFSANALDRPLVKYISIPLTDVIVCIYLSLLGSPRRIEFFLIFLITM